MVRRFAHDILATSQRLTQAGVGPTPVWHAAMLTHPPAPIKPIHKGSVKQIRYPEDAVRLRFFQDFPLEAFRPKILAEREVIRPIPGPVGKDWWALEQRSKNPSSEDCIAFAINLQKAYGLTASKAYAIASAQFAHLRAIQEVATRAAFREARAYGAHSDQVASGELARHIKKTENALKSWAPKVKGTVGTGAGNTQKKAGSNKASGAVWQMDALPSYRAQEGRFSGGQDWIQGWDKWQDWTAERRKRKEDYLRRERSARE